tara:strand:+ start:122 stop:415 length:294 start_codon:yes stop_codon:yes gene_type:complete
MAYKPKKKQKEEIRREVIETITNPTIESLSNQSIKEDLYIHPLPNIEKLPDPKLHQIVSFIKSGMRIIGYCLIPYNLGVAASILVLSEVVGIIEELV